MKIKYLILKFSQSNKIKVREYIKRKNKWVKNPKWSFYYDWRDYFHLGKRKDGGERYGYVFERNLINCQKCNVEVFEHRLKKHLKGCK